MDIIEPTRLFKTLSDESRVRILHLILVNEEMCISDLELILDFTQTKTSRLVAYMKNVGLLKLKKIDQWAYYSLNPQIKDTINTLLTYFHGNPILKKDLEEYKTLYANNELAIRKLHTRQKKYILPSL
ncbi:MAG: metalloregulator ArsR/SmtB family transcription factor [Cytophagaceae bacterium]|nr:metalloregulator ArsR/SmtB family transcription factor [Cytophagaceae bacterium]MDW8457002.1 metalloregulator ArsR/SmtB family transcription factor [Cytophagaceae bacterium]